MVEEEKRSGPIDPERGDGEAPESDTKGTHAWLVLAGILSILAFLAYTKTPYHINNCVHHIRDHLHLPSGSSISAAISQQVSSSRHVEVPLLQKRAVDAENKTEVCTNPTCVTYAKQIRANLAKNYTQVGPCEDFNTYACQGWEDSNDWRPDQAGMLAKSKRAKSWSFHRFDWTLHGTEWTDLAYSCKHWKCYARYNQRFATQDSRWTIYESKHNYSRNCTKFRHGKFPNDEECLSNMYE
jgi:hypothetical protein